MGRVLVVCCVEYCLFVLHVLGAQARALDGGALPVPAEARRPCAVAATGGSPATRPAITQVRYHQGGGHFCRLMYGAEVFLFYSLSFLDLAMCNLISDHFKTKHNLLSLLDGRHHFCIKCFKQLSFRRIFSALADHFQHTHACIRGKIPVLFIVSLKYHSFKLSHSIFLPWTC